MTRIKNLLGKVPLIIDGAMGTELQKKNLLTEKPPELLNITDPGAIAEIHAGYIEAGANIITANTFGASLIKLEENGIGDKLAEINEKGMKIALDLKKNGIFVAGSLGPTGKLLYPLGDMDFDAVKNSYKAQVEVLVKSGADLIMLETMTDILELKAAIVAVRELSRIPLFAGMTFERNGLTFTGCSPESMAVLLDAMDVDAIGTNCGTGPEETGRIISRIKRFTEKALYAYPNAGIPVFKNGKTIFPLLPAEYIELYKEHILPNDIDAAGGCCGTGPDHIRELKKCFRELRRKGAREIQPGCAVSSRNRVTLISPGSFTVIGERINPTSKKLMKEEFKSGKTAIARKEALEQSGAGAGILDINVSTGLGDERSFIRKLTGEIQGLTDTPLSIDSPDTGVIEEALKVYAGKALINSTTGENKKMKEIFSLARKYGAAVIGLTLDEKGIPSSVKRRINIAKKIARTAARFRIKPSHLLIDPLTLTVGSRQDQVKQTLDAIKYLSNNLGLNTVIGLSNISFGMPRRQVINRTFLVTARAHGLTSAILDPLDQETADTLSAMRLLEGEDLKGERYLARFGAGSGKEAVKEDELKHAVISGNREGIEAVINSYLKDKGLSPKTLLDSYMIPAIRQVGELYEKGIYFLPQLTQASEAMKKGVEYLRPMISAEAAGKKSRVLIATVEGDIHDIGKNIVKLVLENNGYDVTDIGKDVKDGVIIKRALEEKPEILALSALMTTTMAHMKIIADALGNDTGIKIIIGGAAVSADYAEELGVLYGKDAVDALRKIEAAIGTSR